MRVCVSSKREICAPWHQFAMLVPHHPRTKAWFLFSIGKCESRVGVNGADRLRRLQNYPQFFSLSVTYTFSLLWLAIPKIVIVTFYRNLTHNFSPFGREIFCTSCNAQNLIIRRASGTYLFGILPWRLHNSLQSEYAHWLQARLCHICRKFDALAV